MAIFPDPLIRCWNRIVLTKYPPAARAHARREERQSVPGLPGAHQTRLCVFLVKTLFPATLLLGGACDLFYLRTGEQKCAVTRVKAGSLRLSPSCRRTEAAWVRIHGMDNSWSGESATSRRTLCERERFRVWGPEIAGLCVAAAEPRHFPLRITKLKAPLHSSNPNFRALSGSMRQKSPKQWQSSV